MRLTVTCILLALLGAGLTVAAQGAPPMSVSPTETETVPGGTTVTTVTLTNAGSLPRTLTLTAVGNASVTFQPDRLTLLPGATETSRATVTTSADLPVGRYVLRFEARETTTLYATANHTLDVRALRVDASLISPPPRIPAGGNTTVSVRVVSNANGTIDVNATGPTGWRLHATPPAEVVHATSSGTSTLRIEPPADTEPGAYVVQFHARLRDRNATTTLDIPVEVMAAARPTPTPTPTPTPPPASPTFTPARLDVEAPRGASTRAQASVHNPGATTLSLDAALALPPGWTSPDAPTRVTLAPNETLRVAFDLHAGATASDGQGHLALTGNGTNATLPLTLRVLDPPPTKLTLDPAHADATVRLGETTTLTITARLDGPASARYAATLATPAGWRATVFPESGLARPGEPFTLRIDVDAEEGATAGELTLSLTTDTATARATVALTHARAPPTPATPPPARDDETRLEPREIVIVAGGNATATLHVPRPATLRLVLPAGLTTPDAVLHLTPSAQGGHTATFRIHAAHDAAPGLRTGARIDGLAAPIPLPIRVIAPVVSAAVSPPTDDANAPVVIAAGAALVGGAALALAWAHRKWPLAFAALYTRLKPSELLQHPMRRRMRETIEAEPGIAVGALQQRLGLSNGTMAHHLQRLERAGIVVSMMDGQWRRLYPTGQKPREGGGTLPERALRALAGRGAVPAARLADELGVSRQALHYHLKRLAQEGRIRAKVAGGVLSVELIAAEAPPRAYSGL